MTYTIIKLGIHERYLMSRMLETISYLSRTIGPRPAGTEEEQQAALYLAEEFQQKANLSTTLDDFNCYSSPWILKMIAGLGILVVVVFAFLLPDFTFLWFVLALAIGGLYIAEYLGFSIVERFLLRGASQNVVARYEPLPAQDSRSNRRKRKIILIAHYDSGKTNILEQGMFVRYLPYAKRASFASFALIPALLLLKSIVPAVSPVTIFLNCLVVISLLGVIFLLVEIGLSMRAPYNEAANCNASGVAVLLEVAQRINLGKTLAEEEGAEEEDASNLESLSQDSQSSELSLATENIEDFNLRERSPEERLLGAKAAIAALTGKKLAGAVPQDIAQNLVEGNTTKDIEFSEQQQHKQNQETLEAFAGKSNEDLETIPSHSEERLESVESAASQDKAQENVKEELEAVTSPLLRKRSNAGVPDWYARAQKRAQKPSVSRETQSFVKRSRYSDALKAAEEESRTEFGLQGLTAKNDPCLQEELQEVCEAINVKAAELKEDISEESANSLAVVEEVDLDPTQLPEPRESTAEEFTFVEESKLGAPENLAQEPDQVYDEDDKIQALLNQSIMKDEEDNLMPKLEACAQPAPLALAQEEDGQGAARSLLKTSLPNLNENIKGSTISTRPEILLPSMSGTISAYKRNLGNQAVSVTGSFSAIQATGSLAPVGDELVVDMDVEERYVHDVDDSDFEEGFTESGAYAGPDYVEMPQSRFKQFFSKFIPRKHKINPEESTYEWLDVDEDFEARKVGAERKTWESFREDEPESEGVVQDESNKTWYGGASVLLEESGLSTNDRSLEQSIEDFRYGVRIDKEVWFVALGSQCESDLGMKNFMRTYAHDLKGALVVNLEGLGQGDLSFISAEGEIKTYKPSSRMNRLLKKVSRNCGLNIGNAQILWKDSSATQAMKAHIPAMSLVGMEGFSPALYAQGGDVIESLDALTLENNADFIVELIKNV